MTMAQEAKLMGKKSNLLNRNQTDGKFGIYGHVISDLVVERINYDSKKKVVSLSMGS